MGNFNIISILFWSMLIFINKWKFDNFWSASINSKTHFLRKLTFCNLIVLLSRQDNLVIFTIIIFNLELFYWPVCQIFNQLFHNFLSDISSWKVEWFLKSCSLKKYGQVVHRFLVKSIEISTNTEKLKYFFFILKLG